MKIVQQVSGDVAHICDIIKKTAPELSGNNIWVFKDKDGNERPVAEMTPALLKCKTFVAVYKK